MKTQKSLFFTKQVRSIFLFFVACSLIYSATNRINFFSEIVIIENSLDKSIPYIPWTVLIYVSLYPYIFIVLWLCDKEIFEHMLSTYYVEMFVAFLIFLFLPTQYVWDHSKYNDFFTRYVFSPLKELDKSFNSFPSAHVFLSLTAPFILLALGKLKKGLIFLVWGVMISITTVTVKQHYVIDILGGIVFALFFAVISVWLFKRNSSKGAYTPLA